MIINLKRIEKNMTWGVIDRRTGQYKEKYDNCADKFVPALDRVTGMLRTGLTKKDETELEAELQLNVGDLATTSAFWNTFVIIIPEDGLKLNINNPMDKLKYMVLKADPEIATDMSEIGASADAQYKMYTEGEAAKSKNTKRNIIANAYAKFAVMSPDEIVEALYMFGKNGDTVDPEVCRNTLGDVLEKDPEKFLDILGDVNFKDKVFIIRSIRAGILRKTTLGKGFDMPIYFGDIYLGKGLDEVIQFLLDKENQNVYVGLQKAYAALKKEKV